MRNERVTPIAIEGFVISKHISRLHMLSMTQYISSRSDPELFPRGKAFILPTRRIYIKWTAGLCPFCPLTEVYVCQISLRIFFAQDDNSMSFRMLCTFDNTLNNLCFVDCIA